MLRYYIIIIAFLLISFEINAQSKLGKYTLGAGLEFNASEFSTIENYSPGYGINLFFQNNLGRFFSIKTNLNGTFTSPSKFAEISAPTIRITDERQTRLSITSSPLIYYRDQNFSIFVGVGVGVGRFYELTVTTISNNAFSIPPPSIDETSSSSESGWGFALTPTAGIDLKLGNNNNYRGEIQLAVGILETWAGLTTAISAQSYGLKVAYIYTLEE